MTVSDTLHKKLEETKIRQAMINALEETMTEVMSKSIQEAPRLTGNLKRSHSTEVRLSGRVFEGLLKNSANYWQYVNFGTSKMDANDFVTRAFESADPGATLAKHFKSNYKP